MTGQSHHRDKEGLPNGNGWLNPEQIQELLAICCKSSNKDALGRLQRELKNNQNLTPETYKDVLNKLTSAADELLTQTKRTKPTEVIDLLTVARVAAFVLHGKNSSEAIDLLSTLTSECIAQGVFDNATAHFEELFCAVGDTWRGEPQAVISRINAAHANLQFAKSLDTHGPQSLETDSKVQDEAKIQIEKKLAALTRVGLHCMKALENFVIIIRTSTTERSPEANNLVRGRFKATIENAYQLLVSASLVLEETIKEHGIEKIERICPGHTPKARECIGIGYKWLALCLHNHDIPNKVSINSFRKAISFAEKANEDTHLLRASLPFYNLALARYEALETQGKADIILKKEALTVLLNIRIHAHALNLPLNHLYATDKWIKIHEELYPDFKHNGEEYDLESQRVKAYLEVLSLSLKANKSKSVSKALTRLKEIYEKHQQVLLDPEIFQIKVFEAMFLASEHKYPEATKVITSAIKFAEKASGISQEAIARTQLRRIYYLIRNAEDNSAIDEPSIEKSYQKVYRAIKSLKDSKSLAHSGAIQARTMSIYGFAKLSEARKRIAALGDVIFNEELKDKLDTYKDKVVVCIGDALKYFRFLEKLQPFLDNNQDNSYITLRTKVWRLEAIIEMQIFAEKCGAYSSHNLDLIPEEQVPDVPEKLKTTGQKLSRKERRELEQEQRLEIEASNLLRDAESKGLISEESVYRPKEALDLAEDTLADLNAHPAESYIENFKHQVLTALKRLREHFQLNIKATNEMLRQQIIRMRLSKEIDNWGSQDELF
ncbi:MAG: hypothetical protein R3A13_10395 [Bdellovibrionota bacterium]